MKARDLLIQLTTLCANNPQVLDKEVEILDTMGGAVNPVSLSLEYLEPVEDEDEGTMAEPHNIAINVL